MKKLNILFFITLAATVLSCKKNHTDNTIVATTIDITVTDGNTGTAAAGAAVALYDNSNNAVTGNAPKYTATTDQTGKVKITVAYISQYLVIAAKGSEKNYYSGLLPVGIFKTQAEIQNSPGQTPPAVIGSVKFQDTNGDGVITALDNVAPSAVSITAKANNTFRTTIY